jgi:hypothetical protein
MFDENSRTGGQDVGEETPMAESFYVNYLTLARNALKDFEQKLPAAGVDKAQIDKTCRSVNEGPFITLANELRSRGEGTAARTIALFASSSRRRPELLREIKEIIEEKLAGRGKS